MYLSLKDRIFKTNILYDIKTQIQREEMTQEEFNCLSLWLNEFLESNKENKNNFTFYLNMVKIIEKENKKTGRKSILTD